MNRFAWNLNMKIKRNKYWEKTIKKVYFEISRISNDECLSILLKHQDNVLKLGIWLECVINVYSHKINNKAVLEHERIFEFKHTVTELSKILFPNFMT